MEFLYQGTYVGRVRPQVHLTACDREVQMRLFLLFLLVPLIEIATHDMLTERLRAALGLKAKAGVRQ